MAANLYYPLYLALVTILTLVQYASYKRTRPDTLFNAGQAKSVFPFLLAVSFALFIGLRPASYLFVDTMNYVADYNGMEGNYFIFDPEAMNYFFDNLLAWTASKSLGYSTFFLIIASIYFGGAWYACKRLFPADPLASFLVFLAAFSTFSYGTNGIKAGAAASLFLIALSFRGNLLMAVLMLFVTLGFHHSMVLPLVAYAAAYFYRNTKLYFFVWLVCLLMAALHVTFFQTLFAGYSDESGAGYLNSVDRAWGGKTGFRIDFVLYSAMPVWVGYWAIYKRKLRSVMYEFILSVYLITNSVWMLCMYAAFTNRIAYLSWGLYPIALIYPFLNEQTGRDRYRKFAKVMLCHLGFTLFMTFIYY